MIERQMTIDALHEAALDQAIHSTIGSMFIGLSTYGGTRPISLWFEDAATPNDIMAATVILTTHDPVFLSINKTRIAANGLDAAIVTVRVLRLNAEPVTLLVNNAPVLITLTNKIGTLEITSADPANITIAVQNPVNRTTDSLILEAV